MVSELGVENISDLLLGYFMEILTKVNVIVDDVETPGIPSITAFREFGWKISNKYIFSKYLKSDIKKNSGSLSEFKQVYANEFSDIYNKLIQLFNFYEYYKYLMSFKDFFFQLMYENVEYCLILIFMNIKKLNISNNFSFLNKRNKIINNFIYRKYMFYTWLEYRYYDDLFDDLIFFEKGAYSEKLSKWILRYFYSKFESQKFYSESLNNNYINKNRIFL